MYLFIGPFTVCVAISEARQGWPMGLTLALSWPPAAGACLGLWLFLTARGFSGLVHISHHHASLGARLGAQEGSLFRVCPTAAPLLPLEPWDPYVLGRQSHVGLHSSQQHPCPFIFYFKQT